MPTIRIGKLDAARRQLQTAITMWFAEDDPVSTHTLAFAAYEIIHVISKKRNPQRETLLFDADFIREGAEKQWNEAIKKHGNFFKHGDRDGEAVINFNPILSVMFIIAAISGLDSCGERRSPAESAFWCWLSLHFPDFLSDDWKKKLTDTTAAQAIAELRTIPKKQFLQEYKALQSLL